MRSLQTRPRGGGWWTSASPLRSRDTARAEQQPRPAASGDFGLDLAQIPIHEAEANRVAEQIATAPLDASRERAPSLTSVQAADTERAAAPPAVHAVVRAAGQQLTPAVRARFEPRLSHDLSSVRVHTDAAAAQSARDINARAYTVGQHVVFDNGQLAPHTAAGRQLLAHELTHVVQQSGNGPSVQRKPGPDAKDKQSVVIARQRAQALVAQMKEDGALTAAAKATMIADLDFFEGAAWQAYNDAIRPTLAAVTQVQGAGSKKTHYWLRDASPGLAELADEFTDTFVPNADLNDARFALSVLRDGVKASLTPEAIRTDKARAAFRARHSRHSDEVLQNIDAALKRITKDNPDLLIAYYEYYANHELTDELPHNMSVDKNAGATAHGDTDINPKVLMEASSFATDSHRSLLGETLIHEYVHTPQDNPNNPVFEAKAYGIESFFAERQGDETRVATIRSVNSDDKASIKRLRYRAYYTMRELYRRIEKGGPEAAEARAMSVEFISQNESAYRPALRAIYDDTRDNYVP